MRQHFRSLVNVHDADGRPMFFRFYDPRVLRVYLPTCNPAESRQVFGPVRTFCLEAEDPGTLVAYSARGGKLRTEETKLPAQ